MQKQSIRKRVEITKHAMQRLHERVKNHDGFRDWAHMVKTARYEGRSEQNFTDAEQEWVTKLISNLHTSSQVRIMGGFAYLFMGNKGHARTLVTVLRVA